MVLICLTHIQCAKKLFLQGGDDLVFPSLFCHLTRARIKNVKKEWIAAAALAVNGTASKKYTGRRIPSHTYIQRESRAFQEEMKGRRCRLQVLCVAPPAKSKP
jgi:hypothetical protein